MKNRKIFIALLLVATLALGVGYAALADDLFVGVTAHYDPSLADDEFATDVYFVSGEGNGYCSAGVSANHSDKDSAYIHIGGEDGGAELSTPDQSAVATFVVQNDYESAVKITKVTADLGALSTYYNVEVDLSGAQNIESGDTGTIVVTVTPKAPITVAIDTEAFTIEFVAELAG